MKVSTKLKINRTFIASLEIKIDELSDGDEKEWWKSSLSFIKDVKDNEWLSLSKPQQRWLTNISIKLKQKGIF